MQLLVSVATADDARAAADGGADIVDAKDPGAGALGAVTLARLREIRDAAGGAQPLSAALGDATDEQVVARQAREYSEAGACLVKVGLLGTSDVGRAEALLSAAVSGARGTRGGLVAVAYADAGSSAALPPCAIVAAAARARARGVLIDTMNKNGPGLLGVISAPELERWIAAAHDAGLIAAVAGKLSAGDLNLIDRMGADVAGVRGAACLGGRSGQVSADLVRELVRSRPAPEHAAPRP
jgi:(5-formylfuran-3-yl)methyl phosphate synthase